MNKAHEQWRVEMLPKWEAFAREAFGREYKELTVMERAIVLAGTR